MSKMVKVLILTLIGCLMFSITSFADIVGTATINKGVNFRPNMSTSSTPYGLIHAGTTVNLIAANDYWLLVEYNGKQGYISRPYATLNIYPVPVSTPAPTPVPAPVVNPVSKTAQLVDYAESFQGGRVTYVFDSNNVAALRLDCSSFTKMIFAHFGINLIWGSRAQSKQGSYVSKPDLQPGDLVFFSVNTPGQINHVGIYVGDGKFVNNLPKQGVVISNMNSSYWVNHYITARRLL